MPRARATWRASSTASVPQQLPNRFVGSSSSWRGQTRMVTPTTSHPCSTSRAAATDESTPPLMPTTMRSAMWLRVWCLLRARALVPRAQHLGEPLELIGRRVADFDLTLSLAANDPHPRHQTLLEGLLERRQLDGATPAFARRHPAGLGERFLRANRILGRTDGPVVSQNLIAQPKLFGDRRQREQRPRVAHRQ